jgi:hypothetical protein
MKFILNHLHRYKAPVKVMVLDGSCTSIVRVIQ